MRNLIKHTILYPFSLIYGLVTGFRNWMFDQEIIRSTSFNIPIICIGNLAVGGTGKTPHTEFLLSILNTEWKTAMLSRGYKRMTKGFQLANQDSNSYILGDEPFQIFKKFPTVLVAVDENRVHGVKKLLELTPKLQLVILDDAFQHRYIQTGLSILLTDYSNLYNHDLLLPAGNLREWKSGSKRADIIIVTKCPQDLRPIDMRLIETELKPENNQSLFFSTYVYTEIIPVFPGSNPENWTYNHIKKNKASVLLVAGIVSPEPIVEHLQKFTDTVETIFFDDHHAFQSKDYALIISTLENIKAEKKLLLVTEKDAARMASDSNFPEELKVHTFALPIQVKILHNQETLFNQKIKNYVIENSRNR